MGKRERPRYLKEKMRRKMSWRGGEKFEGVSNLKVGTYAYHKKEQI
jgi:hypothetical protein